MVWFYDLQNVSNTQFFFLSILMKIKFTYKECIMFVEFYGISSIVGYLMPNPLYIYTYIYIKYIWFGLVGFYGISTLVGYLSFIFIYIYIWFLHK